MRHLPVRRLAQLLGLRARQGHTKLGQTPHLLSRPKQFNYSTQGQKEEERNDGNSSLTTGESLFV
jgi:hypothetical protein